MVNKKESSTHKFNSIQLRWVNLLQWPLGTNLLCLIWHVWAEVVFDISNPPAGQLILWQVEAEAAQLENCGLGFRSLQKEHAKKKVKKQKQNDEGVLKHS